MICHTDEKLTVKQECKINDKEPSFGMILCVVDTGVITVYCVDKKVKQEHSLDLETKDCNKESFLGTYNYIVGYS